MVPIFCHCEGKRVRRQGKHRKRKGWIVAKCLITTALCLGAYVTRHNWLRMGAESLVCESGTKVSDAVLIDHVEDNYLLFKRARQLQMQGVASTILVPILEAKRNDEFSIVSREIADVLCHFAHISSCVPFSVLASEPISLTLAKNSAKELQARGVRSVILVTNGFRSRRAYMIYSKVFDSFGINVHCQPVFGARTPSNWFNTAHGIQDVGLQFAKLWYYRLVVLR